VRIARELAVGTSSPASRRKAASLGIHIGRGRFHMSKVEDAMERRHTGVVALGRCAPMFTNTLTQSPLNLRGGQSSYLLLTKSQFFRNTGSEELL
jgi:hypothetical protein